MKKVMKFWCLVTLVVGASTASVLADDAAQPNFVVIISDDQGYHDFGFMGHPVIKTPHLDRLASESLVFTRGYVTTALCSPSLASMLTGLYPHQHGFTGNDPIKGWGQRQEWIEHFGAQPQLPRLLNTSGYLTLHTGKYWQGHPEKVSGFTDSMGETRRHGSKASLGIGRDTMQPIYDFIGKAQTESKPFMVWYAPFLPHTPHTPPKRLLDKYKDKAPHLVAAKYYAMVEWLDETCGDLLKHLDEQGLSDNTIVLFIVDNGWPHGAGGYRGHKLTPWEQGVRTPVMIRWPGKVAAARDEENLASNLDIPTTILAAARLPVPENMEGINLLDEVAVNKRDCVFIEDFAHDMAAPDKPEKTLEARGVIRGDWKLVVTYTNSKKRIREVDRVFLFDLKKDPKEQHNLIDQHPAVLAELMARLNKWWNPELTGQAAASPRHPVTKSLTYKTVAAAAEKPNIIFILTDDQGYGDVGRHGHPLLKTPHIDRLFDESVRFDNFYVSPSCSPTRAALLTGMHEFRNGVTHTRQPREHLHNDAVLLPQLLKTAGYATGFVGKWHLCSSGEYAPQRRGFDWCSTNAGGPRVHFDPEIIRNRRRTQRQGYREDIFFDEAMTFIDESGDQPFFCYLSTYSPHDPLDAPEEFIAPYRDHVSEKHAKYLGMVANLDYNVGRLLEFLKQRKLDETTILIFMNDNGQTWGLDVYNAGMRGCKCTIWEGGSRAISFWRWPGQWKPHQVDNLTAHLDVLPTLCELAGVDVPNELRSELEGFSMVPLLQSKEAISWHDDRMLFHHVARWPSGLAAAHKYAMCGVRQGNYLLLRSRPCDDPECTTAVLGNQCAALRAVEKGQIAAGYTKENARFHWGVSPADRWVLFDTKDDPACQKDLASALTHRVATMAKAYDQWWDDVYPAMIERGGDAELTALKTQRTQ